MILEGIVTTVSAQGEVNIAPMGPHVDEGLTTFVLRPFPTSQTYKNLRGHAEGVIHITDDVLLLAKAAVGRVEPMPELKTAEKVKGFVVATACRYFEFRVRSMDESESRVRLDVDIVHRGRLRDFFGFNRAKHAVVEAAILATRTEFLPIAEIEAEYRKLGVIVGKTGGDQEREAFEFLTQHIATCKQEQTQNGS